MTLLPEDARAVVQLHLRAPAAHLVDDVENPHVNRRF